MLSNRAYIGEAVYKGDSYPGEHGAIIDRETWDRVHVILQESPRKRAARTRADTPALLKGLLYGPDGAAFSPTHTRKGDRLYRYYVSQTVLKHGAGSCPVGRVPAGEVEAAVIDQLRAVFRQPEIVAGTLRVARAQDEPGTDLTSLRVDLCDIRDPDRLAQAVLDLLRPDAGRAVPVTEIALALDIAEVRCVALKGCEGLLLTDRVRSEGSSLANDGHFLLEHHEPLERDGFRCSAGDMGSKAAQTGMPGKRPRRTALRSVFWLRLHRT